MCHRCKSDKCHSDKKKEEGCTSKAIKQCHFDKHEGIYVIDKPGNYHLTKDVKGTLSIQCDNVCLDLCCHTLDANGGANAIVIGQPLQQAVQISSLKSLNADLSAKLKDAHKNGIGKKSDLPLKKSVASTKASSINDFHHIRIFNGSVSGAEVSAIFANNVFDLELFDLTMLNNTLNSVHVNACNSVQVKNVDFSGRHKGERALLFDDSYNLQISECNATEYVSTVGAVIEINSCNTVYVKDVNVTDCVKQSTADFFIFTAETSFIFVGGRGFPVFEEILGSSDVHFERVRANNNVFEDLALADFWRTFSAILFTYSNSCSLTNCETSNNVDITGNSVNIDSEDFFLCLFLCESSKINGHQSNNNSCPESIVYFFPVAILDSVGIELDNVQTNNNYAEELASIFFNTFLIGILTSLYFFGDSSVDVIVKNSQANGNIVNKSGAGRTTAAGNGGFIFAIAAGFFGASEHSVQNCQANNNSILDSEPFTGVVGIINESGYGNISDSEASGNRGGEFAMGIDSFSFGGPIKQTVTNCVAHNNGNYGISLGYPTLDTLVDNVCIKDCVCIANGSQGDAAGIIVHPFSGSNRDIVIQNCKILETGSEFSDEAYGILSTTEATGLVVENCIIENTSGILGYGIFLDNLTDSIVSGCKVIRSQDDGIRVQSASTNNLFENNKAIGNSATGFVDSSGAANAWTGNKAENNGTDYAGIVASTYSKSTGVVAGGASANNIFFLTNISVIA